jgi:hypothetical protein
MPDPHHFHLHRLIPGGALSFDRKRWTPAHKNFLLDVKELSTSFRQKFITLLEDAFQKGDLAFPGQRADLGTQEGFTQLIWEISQKDWVVFSKESLAACRRGQLAFCKSNL